MLPWRRLFLGRRLAIHLAVHMRGAVARLQAAGLGHERKAGSVKVKL